MKEKKTNEGAVKKRNLYFIIVAVCVLLLAAVTVFTVMMTAEKPVTNIETPVDPDKGNKPNEGDDKPNEGDNKPGDDDKKPDDKPTNTEVVFQLPVASASVKTNYSFWYNATLKKYCLHTGIDFAADAGTQVCAAYGGKIESVTDDLLEGGKVIIDHGNGLKTVYASIDVAANVKVGASVNAGDVLGTISAETDVMGKEFKEGAHLHFETLENGKLVNPTAYLDIEEK